MLLILLGWFWVVTGIIFFLKPEWLRKKLQKTGIKKLRKFLFGLAFVLGVMLIKATWGIQGLPAKIVMVIGVIGIIKALFFLKAKAADRLIGWFTGQPTGNLRIYAVCQIAVGVIILAI